MARRTSIQLPALPRLLQRPGKNIKLVGLPRKLSTKRVAERAGMSRTSFRAIKNGETGVIIGTYADVLMCLGLEKDLALVARDDELVRKLQDASLSIRVCASK